MRFSPPAALRTLESSLTRMFERPLAFHMAVLGLIVLYGLIRIPLLGSLGGDEAEQVLFAQALRWGYDVTNPPLYTWMVFGVFALFGKSPGLIIGLKLVVLGLSYIALYHTAVLALGKDRRRDAALVGLSPLLSFFVAWQAIFSYSHALMYALFVILTFMALLKAVGDGKKRWFVMLGLVMGLGSMTKYSYLMFLFSLLAAGLTIPTVRARLLSGRMLAALALGALISLPHAIWLLENADKFLRLTEYKLQISEDLPYFEGVVKGLWNMVRAVFGYLSPLWLVALLLFPKAFKFMGGEDRQPLTSLWLGRAYLIVAAILLGMVLVGGITQFRPNYLFLFILVPLWLFARLPEEYRAGKRIVLYGRLIAICGALSVIMLFGKAVLDPVLCKRCQNFVPYPEIAQALHDEGFTKGTIFAHWYPHPIPGNLSLYLNDARIISRKFPNLKPPSRPDDGQCLIISVAEEQGGLSTDLFIPFSYYHLGIPSDTPYKVKRLKFAMERVPEKYVLLDFVLLNPGVADCH